MDEERTPDLGRRRQRELDVQVEDLTRRLAAVINGAGPGDRQDLREYAVDLLRDATEVVEPRQTGRPHGSKPDTNPLGLAVLLFIVGIPMVLLFFPVGLVLIGFAVVLGLWGVVATIFRRPAPRESH